MDSLTEFHQYATAIADTSVADEEKLKYAQEISQNFETICVSQQYSAFLEYAIPKILTVLKEGDSQFSSDSVQQELRKLLLEIIHRIPANDHMKPHVSSILDVMFQMLQVDNEENVLVCLRIIIELHKQFRPQIKPEIKVFLQYVITFYKEFPNTAKTHFDIVTVTATGHLPVDNGTTSQLSRPGTPSIKVPPVGSPISQLSDSGTSSRGGQSTQIPKATQSLKVLAELPIIVVLMYQLYKQSVQGKIGEFIPVVMNTITLQPSQGARKSANFNKEIYVDFTAAQIKTLSFLAYIVRIFQDLVGQYSTNMVAGMLALFRYCPQEVAHLRKELLIAARHILATELRSKFVPHIEQLFDEDVLIGSGWTVNEALRPLAYSTLADFVHHVRTLLTLPNLSIAVQLFSKNVYDESLPISIQRMSCKLLLNLVECIRQRGDEAAGREILMKMLEVFVRKFQTIAKHHIPAIMVKCEPAPDPPADKKQSKDQSSTLTPSSTSSSSITTFPAESNDIEDDTDPKKLSIGQGSNKDGKESFSVSDYREMVKTLVCGVKTITWGAGSCKVPGDITIPVYPQGNKVFLPSETEIFIRLLKYALVALDVYQISMNPNGNGYLKMTNSPHQIRMKEEKEILEHFAGVFTMLNTATFKEVFSATIEYLVERIHNNYAFQIIPNSFLANPNTSATFATILVNFLLGKLKDMGTKSEQANLYLKLFKLVFGSVSLFAQENEQMLKPHLHEIVNNSMELALTAKEPYNYFLLLRALFRSIGGGNHDLLYQEFLPLLPTLLQGLNNLQSGIHKQYMKDLFVELCLTVPVRLSSLLPYLPMLMDPLVSALNGSQSLVSQGLRTLELCVDNLQPDFLYDHIQPVKSDLMQALWKTLRNPMETMAHVAFRVLGKFGGGGRKMLQQPQQLDYKTKENIGPCIVLYFQETINPVNLPVSVIIEKAVNVLKTQMPSLPVSSQQTNYPMENLPYYREQAWLIAKHFIVSTMSMEDNKMVFDSYLKDESYEKSDINKNVKTTIPPCEDEQSKKTFQQGLTCMLFAASIKELQEDALPFMCGILRQFSLLIVTQQSGVYCQGSLLSIKGMDAHIIIDSIADILSHEDKDLCKYGHLAITLLYETVSIVTKDKIKAAKLPFFEYMAEKLCSCCYERAWFAKSGGCSAIEFMMKLMPIQWVIQHQPMFISALMFVMMDLTNEVSSGAVESAKVILAELLKKCNTPDNENSSLRERYFSIVVQNMVREVVSPNHTVREQARKSLEVLSQVTGKSVHALMEPHKSLLEDMIPPKKHLLRHQPVNTQIALMDGNTFCTSLSPRLFTMDLSIVEHKVFFTELYTLCEADDTALTKLPCYKSVTSFSQLRVSALAALTSCHYIVQAREKIFNVLVKAINSPSADVMQSGKENMQKFIAGGALESVKELVSVNIRPLLLMLGDYRSLSMAVLQKLTCFMELFPELFNEKLCEQLLAHLRRWMETAISTSNTQSQQQVKPAVRSTEEIKICSAIMNMFHLVPAASSKLIEPLITLTVKTERAIVLEIGSPFRKPLIDFLLRYPQDAVDYFLANISDSLINRLFICILKREDTKEIRCALEGSAVKLVNSTFIVNIPQTQLQDDQNALMIKRQSLQFQGILIIRTLVKFNSEWLAQQPVLITHLRRIWNNHPLFEKGKKKTDSNNSTYWREIKLLAKCLLTYVQHKTGEIEILFQLLKVYIVRSIPSLNFIKNFLETICKTYSGEEKRSIFFKFVECFHDQSFNQDLKAMILQHIILPMFEESFKSQQTDELIGGPPNPEHDSNTNVISVFVNKVIDPEHPFATNDSVRILLLQFSALLVEHAGAHIHDAANRKQGNKLKRLYIFAWPCLLSKQCVDPATKYHGFYLQAHIIIKFAIHKKFVLQVFHGLLKAHGQEARAIVRQGLDILTPVMPTRMDDGYTMLSHWTKKIIVEEGHTLSQLVHVLHLLVRHHNVYFPVRLDLVQHMINSMQRLGFTQSATIEHRKLAVDLAEVIVEWEKRRYREELGSETPNNTIGVKRQSSVNGAEPGGIKRQRSNAGQRTSTEKPEPSNTKGFERNIFEAVCNFLFRVACQVNDASTTGNSPGEALSKRCFKILQCCFKPYCWPDAELRVTWLDKLFLLLEQTPTANFANISMALEILTYLCTIKNKHDLIAVFKPLQRGIVACMTCQNVKVVKGVHALLQKLLALYPIEPMPISAKTDELESLYSSIGTTVYDGLVGYETNPSTTVLYGPVMLLKAACISSPSYLDKFLIHFMKAIQKMQKDHVGGQAGESGGLTDLLITSLELAKTRLSSMHGDMRKVFLTILTTLIEKSPEAKLLKAMIKMVDDWVRTKSPLPSQNNVPSIREKSLLLYRMMLNFEKRFADDMDLHTQFLEIVNFVYRDKTLCGSELTARLEPAFLAGLRSVNPIIRTKFMEIFDKSMKKRIYDRFVYIISTQNWEHMGTHYWIKQCLELLLSVVQSDRKMTCSSLFSRLPSCSSVIRQHASGVEILKNVKQRKAEMAENDSVFADVKIKVEPLDENETAMKTDSNEDVDTILPKYTCLANNSKEILRKMEADDDATSPAHTNCEDVDHLTELINRQGKFLEQMTSFSIGPLVHAVAQLAHRSTILAHKIWVDLFPHLWNLLDEKHHMMLTGELGPFLSSGSHLTQADGYRSSINTIVEGMSRCDPPIPIRPVTLKYLGKTHNLWHQAALLLENMAVSCDDMVSVNPHLPLQQPWLDFGLYDDEVSELPIQETFDSLAEMYEYLSEDDMAAGLWQRKARFQETITALSYEQQGLFELSQTSYEAAMTKARDQSSSGRLDPRLLAEYQLWEDRWIRCAKELGQWDILIEFGESKAQSNPFIILESAWRIPDWQVMKEALTQVEVSYPESLAYQLTLYRGYITICHQEDQNLSNVEKLVESASTQAIRQWRKLPHIVSSVHKNILRAAQQIIELQEASMLHIGLQQQNIGRMSSLHDMKATVKTWRHRLPLQCDDLVHWSDIFMWRHHHYQAIVAAYENLSSQLSNETQSNNHAMLGVHASAWSIIYYGYIARKHGLTGVCLDSLSRIHTIPSVPIVDCFQKIRQQVKCYLQMAGVMGKQELQEGLEVIESTNLRYFTKEMTAEFFALKGMFLAQVGRSEEANKAFSEAVQMHDTLVKAWALWGDYLDTLFVSERNVTLGVYALICYLHACRSNHEAKCRKYLARSLWLLTYDDDKATLADTLEKYCIGVHPAHWLPWIPQLLTCLVRKEGQRVLNLIFSIGRVFPQAVYFPIRTLYLTLKIEQREKYKLGLVNSGKSSPSTNGATPPQTDKGKSETSGSDAATPSSIANKILSANSDSSVTSTYASSLKVQPPRPFSSNTTVLTQAKSTASAASPSTNTSSSVPFSPSNSKSTSGSTPLLTSLSTSVTSSTLSTTTSTTQQSTTESGGLIRAPPQMWRCSRIMHMLRDLHPTLLSALEGIVDQMVWFRECWHEDVLRQLRQGLAKCYQVAFEHRGDVNGAQITPRTLSFVKKLVSTFGIGFESASNVSQTFSSAASESLARRAQITAQDPVFQKLKGQFSADFDFSHPSSMKLHALISKLKKWIKILEAKAKLLPSSFLLEETCRFISNFSQSTAEVELPGEFLMPKATTHNAFYVRIAKFMPRVELVQRHNFSARRLTIRGHNGKLYPYLVVNDAWLTESRREERVLQLLRMLNHFFEKRKETCRRGLQFTVPRVVAVSPQMRLIEDNPSYVSLSEIYKERCEKRKVHPEQPVALYYEKLSIIQSRGYMFNHQSLREILKEIQNSVVPETLLKEWATCTYSTATEFWTFRKKLTQQISLAGFVEFVLHLTRLGPEMINIARDCGNVTFNYFRFDIDDAKGELDANRPVPFRLTPNLCEFISPVGVNGIITHCMIAVARCLVQPQFSVNSYFKAILKDELISWNKKKQDEQNSLLTTNQSDIDNELLITSVTNASTAMMTRLQNLAIFENAESKVSTLISAASNPDNTCRMDPAWHPWL